MFRRALVAALAFLVLTTTATYVDAGTLDENKRGIRATFDLSPLRAGERRAARRALKQCHFDWRVLSEPRRIKVRTANVGPASGYAHISDHPKIVIDAGLFDWNRRYFKSVLLSEAAHMADFYFLKPHGLRDDVRRIYHAGSDDSHPWLFEGDYRDQIGEAWMFGFTRACAPRYYIDDYFTHVSTTRVAERVRALLPH